MIAFVEDDLRDVPAERLRMFYKILVLIPDRDVLVSRRLSRSGERQASFLSLIRLCFVNDHRIDHDDICKTSSNYYYPFAVSDHVRGHSNAPLAVGPERVLKVLRDRQVGPGRFLGFFAQKKRISYDRLDHVLPPSIMWCRAQLIRPVAAKSVEPMALLS